MMDLNEAIKVFNNEQVEITKQLQKVRHARFLERRVKRMIDRYPEIAFNIQCEAAVKEAQRIINS